MLREATVLVARAKSGPTASDAGVAAWARALNMTLEPQGMQSVQKKKYQTPNAVRSSGFLFLSDFDIRILERTQVFAGGVFAGLASGLPDAGLLSAVGDLLSLPAAEGAVSFLAASLYFSLR